MRRSEEDWVAEIALGDAPVLVQAGMVMHPPQASLAPSVEPGQQSMC
jgi:hypothetical protein